MPEDPSEDTRESMMGDGLNLETGKKRRDEQFKATKDLSENPEEEGQDEVEQSIVDLPSEKMFQRKARDDAELKDFVPVKIIGKGTFGKVYLVKNNKNGLIYAMKCIRKDVVLKNQNIDSLKLEKEILFNIDHPFLVSMDYVF